MSFFILLIIIIVIISVSTNKNKDSKTTNVPKDNFYRPIRPTPKPPEPRKPKEIPEKDPCDMIGYKRCPNCLNTVSKKSQECFMCGYVFDDLQKK